MKAKALARLACLAGLWAGAVTAQVATEPPPAVAQCPALPDESAQSLRWSAMRIPGMLLCRATSIENGEEAFALTFTRESPFRPRRSQRAEPGVFNGTEIYWYRGEVANNPNALFRETLIELEEDQLVHIVIEAKDPETLNRYQQLALSLPLTPAAD